MSIERIECLKDVPIAQDGSPWSRVFKKGDGWSFSAVGVPSGCVRVTHNERSVSVLISAGVGWVAFEDTAPARAT